MKVAWVYILGKLGDESREYVYYFKILAIYKKASEKSL